MTTENERNTIEFDYETMSVENIRKRMEKYVEEHKKMLKKIEKMRSQGGAKA